ncbi:MAG: hypothetical protein RL235_353 [Chlamydiota bacterium]|jgi:putative component of membrane protein insertase Oxa1/YidC/SpoIIIJ protein YidD
MKWVVVIFWAAALFAEYQRPWGNDAELKSRAPMAIAPERSLATKAADLAIDFHQQVISPVDGPRSHFRPSSSQYAREAMHRYGFLKGFVMGCDRLLRENNEEWVYRKIESDGKLFKYDPAVQEKYSREPQ